jgi:ABC-type sugar transport system ATPase subunit
MRPEAVNVSAEAIPSNGIRIAAEVEAFEADFVHRIQTVYLRSGRWTYSGQCPLDMKLQIGQRVQAEVDPERLYFFDTNSGLRI